VTEFVIVEHTFAASVPQIDAISIEFSGGIEAVLPILGDAGLASATNSAKAAVRSYMEEYLQESWPKLVAEKIDPALGAAVSSGASDIELPCPSCGAGQTGNPMLGQQCADAAAADGCAPDPETGAGPCDAASTCRSVADAVECTTCTDGWTPTFDTTECAPCPSVTFRVPNSTCLSFLTHTHAFVGPKKIAAFSTSLFYSICECLSESTRMSIRVY
jgi:hypothetical protein